MAEALSRPAPDFLRRGGSRAGTRSSGGPGQPARYTATGDVANVRTGPTSQFGAQVVITSSSQGLGPQPQRSSAPSLAASSGQPPSRPATAASGSHEGQRSRTTSNASEMSFQGFSSSGGNSPAGRLVSPSPQPQSSRPSPALGRPPAASGFRGIPYALNSPSPNLRSGHQRSASAISVDQLSDRFGQASVSPRAQQGRTIPSIGSVLQNTQAALQSSPSAIMLDHNSNPRPTDGNLWVLTENHERWIRRDDWADGRRRFVRSRVTRTMGMIYGPIMR